MFWKSISSHSHAFLFLIFNVLRCIFKNQVIFSKKMFFQIFDWSNLFFDQSKSFLKILVSLCLVRLIKPIFRPIEHRESGFLKHGSWLFQKSFFQKFSSFLSLSPIQTWLHLSVLSFLILSFAGFLSPNTGKTLLPFFLFLFSHFMHF